MNPAEEAVDDILAHFGTKGMKWGVRKSASRVGASARRRTGRSGPQEVVVKDRPTRKRIKTTGGEGRPAHPEAIGPRVTGQIVRKSGVKALSDAELRAYTTRLNLEQNAKRLEYEDSSLGRKFVMSALRQTGKDVERDVNRETSRMVRRQGKRAIKAAIAVAA